MCVKFKPQIVTDVSFPVDGFCRTEGCIGSTRGTLCREKQCFPVFYEIVCI